MKMAPPKFANWCSVDTTNILDSQNDQTAYNRGSYQLRIRKPRNFGTGAILSAPESIQTRSGNKTAPKDMTAKRKMTDESSPPPAKRSCQISSVPSNLKECISRHSRQEKRKHGESDAVELVAIPTKKGKIEPDVTADFSEICEVPPEIATFQHETKVHPNVNTAQHVFEINQESIQLQLKITDCPYMTTVQPVVTVNPETTTAQFVFSAQPEMTKVQPEIEDCPETTLQTCGTATPFLILHLMDLYKPTTTERSCTTNTAHCSENTTVEPKNAENTIADTVAQVFEIVSYETVPDNVPTLQTLEPIRTAKIEDSTSITQKDERIKRQMVAKVLNNKVFRNILKKLIEQESKQGTG